MEVSSILHLKALEKLFMLHFSLFGWRPHRGQQYIAPKHMGISLLIFFLFPFFHILTALLNLAQAQTNPFGVLTIFSESLIRQLRLNLRLLTPHLRHSPLRLKAFQREGPTFEVLRNPPRSLLSHLMHALPNQMHSSAT